MKKAKLMLAAMLILVVVAGTLAFKLKRGAYTHVWVCNTAGSPATCAGGFILEGYAPTNISTFAVYTIPHATTNPYAYEQPCNEYCNNSLFLEPRE